MASRDDPGKMSKWLNRTTPISVIAPKSGNTGDFETWNSLSSPTAVIINQFGGRLTQSAYLSGPGTSATSSKSAFMKAIGPATPSHQHTYMLGMPAFRSNGARDFNGTTDRIDFPSPYDATNGPITVSVWIKWNRVTTYQNMLAIGNPTDTASGMYFPQQGSYWNGAVGFILMASTYAYRSGNWGNVFIDRWHRYSCTWDGSTSSPFSSHAHVLIDGKEIAYSGTGNIGLPLTGASGKWSVGGDYSNDVVNTDGQIGEIAAWNRVLSADEQFQLDSGIKSAEWIQSGLVFLLHPDDARNLIGGAEGTLDGTTLTDGPSLGYIPRCNQSAYLFCGTRSTTNQSVYMNGKDPGTPVTSSKPCFLAGKTTTTSSKSAFLSGPPSTAQSNKSVYLVGTDIIIRLKFEDGTTNECTSIVGNDITVDGEAALGGSLYGLKVVIDDSDADYVTKSLAVTSTTGRWSARFYFDPNTYAPFTGPQLCALRNANSQSIAWIQYSNSQIILYSMKDGMPPSMNTNPYTITDGPHCIEFKVIRATSNVANNGSIELIIDNDSKETRSNIDNYDTVTDVKTAWLGCITEDSQNPGTLYFDELVINNSAETIGPNLFLSSSKPAYLRSGNIASVHSYLSGMDHPNNSTSAYLEGGIRLNTSKSGYTRGQATAPPPIAFESRFEIDYPTDWDLYTAGIANTTAARQNGSGRGLSVTLGTNAWVRKELTGLLGDIFTVGFYIDPNDFTTLASNHGFWPLYTYRGSGPPLLLGMWVRLVSPLVYEYQITGEDDNGNSWYSNYFTLNNSSQSIEIHYKRARNATSYDASVSIWKNNNLEETVTGIDCYDSFRNISYLYFGAGGTDTGVSGTLYLDEFAFGTTEQWINTNNIRSAYLMGKPISNIPAYLRGCSSATSSKSCYLKGSSNSSSSIAIYTIGRDTAISNKLAYLQGIISVTDSRPAYSSGVSTDASTNPAYLYGTATAATNPCHAYLKGQDESASSSQAYTAGQTDSSGSTSAFINGGEVTNAQTPAYLTANTLFKISWVGLSTSSPVIPPQRDSKSAYLAGSNNTLSAITAYLSGMDLANSSLIAYLIGQLTSTAWSFLKGGINVNHSNPAYLTGKDIGSDATSVFIAGNAQTASILAGYTRGSSPAVTNQNAYLGGTDQAFSGQNACIHGQDQALVSIPSYLVGWATSAASKPAFMLTDARAGSSKPSYMMGYSANASAIIAFLVGNNHTLESKQAYLEGVVRSNAHAYVHGGILNNSQTHVYLGGQNEGESSRYAYTRGLDARVSGLHGYLQGKQETASSVISYLRSQNVHVDSRQGFLRGQDTLQDTAPCYTQGQQRGTGSVTCYLAGGVLSSSNQPVYLKGEITTASRASAYAQGYLANQSAIIAFMVGKASATGQQSAFIVGQLVSQISGFIRGSENVNILQKAFTRGLDYALANLHAYSRGSQEVQDSLWAFIRGQQSALHSLPGYLKGQEEVQNTTPVYLRGRNSSIASHSVFLEGKPALVQTQSSVTAFAQGYLANQSSTRAWLAGRSTANSTKSAFLIGSIKSSKSAYLKGSINIATTHQVYTKGKVYANNQLASYLKGQLRTTSSHTGYLRGANQLVQLVHGYLRGRNILSSILASYLRASSSGISSKGAFLQGTEARTKQTAYLAGTSTAQMAQSAYLSGVEAAQSAQPAYLEGLGSEAGSTHSAYLKGDWENLVTVNGNFLMEYAINGDCHIQEDTNGTFLQDYHVEGLHNVEEDIAGEYKILYNLSG